jgi:multiple sugar transport system permease protein
MPIISHIGRKTLTMRLAIALIYLVLILGGLTMIYPFALMVSGSVTNAADQHRQTLLPGYWFSRDLQFTKYLANLYHPAMPNDPLVQRRDLITLYYTGESRVRLEVAYDDEQFIAHGVPEAAAIEAHPEQFVPMQEDWRRFIADRPPLLLMTLNERKITDLYSAYLREKYRELARQHYTGTRLSTRALDAAALRLINAAHGIGYPSFDKIPPIAEPIFVPSWVPDMGNQRLQDWLVFKSTVLQRQHPHLLQPVTGRQFWYDYLVKRFGDATAYNLAYGTDYSHLAEVPFPPLNDAVPDAYPLWGDFVREGWPVLLTRITPSAALDTAWRGYLLARAAGDPGSFTARFGVSADAPVARQLPATLPLEEGTRLLSSCWAKFVREQVPASARSLELPEHAWADFLHREYANPSALPVAYSNGTAGFQQVEMPVRQTTYAYWLQHRGAIFRSFLFDNYIEVFRYIATRGRALPNTLILVVLTLLFTLTVNPIAAYALSRFRLKQTQKILLFFIATMAFPAEIASIPSFLLMRDLHLLNTFWAIVIPGMASGFSIFLLKGFFDSLPQELYEAAQIDGAGEYTIFTEICLPLTTPILAVIGLNAFTLAYSSWAWAMLACQKEEMWTLMVWLMQMQLGWHTPTSLIMASLVVASLPMLFVFLFAQRIILRGMVVPEMK